MATYQIAVVGTEYIGLEHAKAICENPRAALRTIGGSERSRERLEALQAEFAAERVTTNYGEIVEDEGVAGLEAGKHVFCEKPMATTLEDCRRMVAAVDRSGKQFMAGPGARFRPLRRAVKALYDEGKLGEACFCESDYVHSLKPFLDGLGHQWWRHPEEGAFAVIGGGVIRWI